MLGGRAPDPRLAAAADTVAILRRLVEDPTAVKAVLADLGQLHDTIRDEIAQGAERHEKATAELAEAKAAHAASEEALAARERDLATRERATAQVDELLTAAKQAIQARTDDLDHRAAELEKAQAELAERQKIQEAAHLARARELDVAHETRSQEAGARHAELDATLQTRSLTLDRREATLGRDMVAYNDRVGALAQREAALRKTEADAAALKAEYQGKIEKLRALAAE